MEFNIKIKGNTISGDPNNGYYYTRNVRINDGTGIKFSDNTLSNPTSGNMMVVESGSIDVYNNKFVRAASIINSYIYFTSGSGHQVHNNYFDKLNVNNTTDEDLIKEGVAGSFISDKNINEVQKMVPRFSVLGRTLSFTNGTVRFQFPQNVETWIRTESFLFNVFTDNYIDFFSSPILSGKTVKITEISCKVQTTSIVSLVDIGAVRFGIINSGNPTQYSNSIPLANSANWLSLNTIQSLTLSNPINYNSNYLPIIYLDIPGKVTVGATGLAQLIFTDFVIKYTY